MKSKSMSEKPVIRSVMMNDISEDGATLATMERMISEHEENDALDGCGTVRESTVDESGCRKDVTDPGRHGSISGYVEIPRVIR